MEKSIFLCENVKIPNSADKVKGKLTICHEDRWLERWVLWSVHGIVKVCVIIYDHFDSMGNAKNNFRDEKRFGKKSRQAAAHH